MEKEPEIFSENIPSRLCKHCGKCIDLPENAWSEMPEDCGLQGWLFLKREEHKQKIRKMNEQILEFEIMYKFAKSNNKKKKIQNTIKKINFEIDAMKNYGPIDF